MLDDLVFADLIGPTYDAALGDADWGGVLAGLAARFRGSIVLNQPTLPPTAGGLLGANVDTAGFAAYDAHYRHCDPLRLAIRRGAPGPVFVDRMLMPGRDLERTEFYSDFLAPRGMHSALCWHAEIGRGHPAALTIWRSRRAPSWADADIRLLRGFAPHLARSLLIQQRLAAGGARRAVLRCLRRSPELSRRERECLARIARGASSKAIARQLDLSAHTVDEYVESAMRKLGATSRIEAVAIAVTAGLLGA
ncbi:response regulator transcription factor [Inquilinus sp. CA228]|uniref:helix-turn-helix transcriptional regulator n=1 Tax=Inquilinus sp. CA228 TaxID=3455609 RepID=UPI003F8D33F6